MAKNTGNSLPLQRGVWIGAGVVAATALLALFGWGLGIPSLASIRPDWIPMAPSAALLFLLCAVAVFLASRWPSSRAARVAGRVLELAAAAAALSILVLSYRGIHLGIEHLGITITDTPGGPPVGHMSPVTALCFLLATGTLLCLPLGVTERNRRGACAMWIAACLTAASMVLLLAYLFYGAPLFATGTFIPPAVTTSFAFLVLGFTLIGLAVPNGRAPGGVPEPLRQSTLLFAVTFALLATGIVTAGLLFFRHAAKEFQAAAGRDLSAIAATKVDELEHWRQERMGDAAVFHNNVNFAGLVQRFLEDTGDTDARDRLRVWLDNVQKAYHYDRVCLHDASGVERLSEPESSEIQDTDFAAQLAEALRSGRVTFTDFHRYEHDRRIFLSVLVPILGSGAPGQPLGVLVLHIDPNTYLYPLIQRWPVPSQTAETLLVRREGDEVVFLNELRFRKNTALAFRISLTNASLPAVMAVSGREGIVEDRDYRGVPVLACLRKVPDSPWHLVARIDQSEVYLPLRRGLWIMLGMVVCLLAASASILGQLWRGQTARFFQARYEAAKALRESEQFLRSTLDGLSAHIAVVDENGVIVLTNKAYRVFAERNGIEPGAVCEGANYLAVCDAAQGEHSEGAAAFGEGIRAVLTSERPSFELEYPCHSPDEQRWFLGRVTPFAGEGPQRVVVAHETISARKLAEEALRHHEMLLREMGRIAHIGAWEFDPATGEGTWTDEVARIHDLDPAEATNMAKGLSFYQGESRAKIEQAIEEAIGSGTPYDLELELVSAKGVHKWVRTIGNPVVQEGKVVLVRGSFQDISKRKQAESRIEHLNQVLRAIRDVNQLITHETDRDALLRRSCEILISTRGYRSAWVALQDAEGRLDVVAEAGIGEDFCDVRERLEQGEWPECYRRALESPDGIAPVHNTTINCRKCALSRNYRDTAALAGRLRHAGRDFGALVVALPKGVADDADEQSLFRELIGDVAYALHAMETAKQRRWEEARFRTYIENAPFGIFITDRSGRYVDVNPAASKITGYSEDELLTMTIADLLPPEDRKAGQASFQRLIGEGRISEEMPFVHKGGQIRYWMVSAGKLSEDRFLGFTEDITERKRAEGERDKLQAQLLQARKMESIGRLAGGVAHDFNNILQIIMGYSQILVDVLPAESETSQKVREIYTAGERAASLTRQLLAFARKQTISPRVLDLNDAIESMLKMLRRLIGEDIDLAWQPDGDLWQVKMDPGQIDQILANLCVNARDAIDGVGKVTIETKNATFDEAYCAAHVGFVPGDFVMLAVSDDGCGMDEETRARIFEPFFTTKDVGEGTGLGLATVYGIVKQNEGFINVYSEPSEGTTFKIYLPRHAAEVPCEAKPMETGICEGRGETVLIVEDDAAILRLGERMLTSIGYDVHAFGSPREALEFVKKKDRAIQLLITDVVMPEMSGRELADAIRGVCPEIRVLFMSGYTANVIAHRGVLDEGVNFIQKPFSLRDLSKKVREALDR